MTFKYARDVRVQEMDTASKDPWMTIFRSSALTYGMIKKKMVRTQKCRATIITVKMLDKYGLKTGKGK